MPLPLTSRPADGIVLTLVDRAPTAADPRRHELHHFTAAAQVDPPRTLLYGFSSGEELSGGAASADEGLTLVSDADVASSPALGDADLVGPLYRLRFDQYLDRLQRGGVNYLKVLLLDAFKPRWSLYAVDSDGAPLGAGASGVSAAYLARLEELVRKARQRGIAVVIALFASRMLRASGWAACPFNARNNNTGDAFGDGAFITGAPLDAFCVLRAPAAGQPFGALSVPEKLYVVQRELVTRVAETVRRYWNVVLEICDDPRGPGDADAMAGVVDWHVTVAGWLAAALTDRRGRRRRCVEINAGPRLRAALLDALGAQAGAPSGPGGSLVDLVHLRGGEWGGYPGLSADDACGLRSGADPGRRLYAPGAITGGVTEGGVAWPGVDGALGELAARPVVAVLDSDGHHLAQKLPRPYIEAARARGAHFIYRWTAPYLHRVDVARESCDRIGADGRICPARGRAGFRACVTFGLDQRLEQCAAAADPGGLTTVFPPPPAAEAPRLLSATASGDFIELAFTAPPVAPEGYALFVGDTAADVWQGGDLCPDPLPLELAPAGGGAAAVVTARARLPVRPAAVDVFVALAATRGVLTSDLSDALGPLTLPASLTPGLAPAAPVSNAAPLVAIDLPAEVETRRDLRGSVTFANAGAEIWRGPEVGALLQVVRDAAPDAAATAAAAVGNPGLDRLFFPLTAANTAASAANAGGVAVAPGQTVTINLARIALDGVFAETYGADIPALLPYARRPIRFSVAMARRQEIARPDAEEPDVKITPLGAAVDAAPDGRPIAVTVRDPRRLATRHVPETQQLVRKGFALPLADGVDRALHIGSVVATGAGTPGSVIRAAVGLERLARDAGMATRVLRVSYDGSGAVPVGVDIVRLHPIDVYTAAAAPPRRRLHALGAGAAARAPLRGLDGAFTLTVATTGTTLPHGEDARWETLAAAGAADAGAGAAVLAVQNVSAAAAEVVSFTAEIAEDAVGADPRETGGTLAFAAGGPPRYVPLGDGGTHRFLLARLAADRADAVAHGELVLRAGADGVFQRALEVRVDTNVDTNEAPVTVAWRVREVAVDAVPARNRAPAELHPRLAARILLFFNGVDDAREIVDTIRDNRAYRRDTQRAYAVRPKLAAAILAARRKLPGGVFPSVAALADVPGIGPDTFEDIAFTFDEDGTPEGEPG
jgi:hypothetical protein